MKEYMAALEWESTHPGYTVNAIKYDDRLNTIMFVCFDRERQRADVWVRFTR